MREGGQGFYNFRCICYTILNIKKCFSHSLEATTRKKKFQVTNQEII